MKENKKIFELMNVLTILLVAVVTVTGVLSFSTSHSYEVTNQYGDSVKMWGYGIYKNDSFFKAPLFVGTDLTILLLVVPLSIWSFVRERKEQSVESLIGCFGNLSLLLYYSASLSFGVTYNKLHLLYILLFSVCLFSVCPIHGKLIVLKGASFRGFDIDEPDVLLFELFHIYIRLIR